LSSQVGALAEGRTQDTGQLGPMLDEAQHKLQRYVTSLEDRGPQALVDDVSRFARRRPGVFLLGAGLAGFAIGRVVRGAAAGQDGEIERHGTYASSQGMYGGQGAYAGQRSYGDDAWGTTSTQAGELPLTGPNTSTGMSSTGYSPSATDMPLGESSSAVRP
jgi:hypothetical protein